MFVAKLDKKDNTDFKILIVFLLFSSRKHMEHKKSEQYKIEIQNILPLALNRYSK